MTKESRAVTKLNIHYPEHSKKNELIHLTEEDTEDYKTITEQNKKEEPINYGDEIPSQYKTLTKNQIKNKIFEID